MHLESCHRTRAAVKVAGAREADDDFKEEDARGSPAPQLLSCQALLPHSSRLVRRQREWSR